MRLDEAPMVNIDTGHFRNSQMALYTAIYAVMATTITHDS